tara:strand:- start:12557 stop:13138 length:582 start_codon:yes stop_codon:yes gene_type:complete
MVALILLLIGGGLYLIRVARSPEDVPIVSQPPEVVSNAEEGALSSNLNSSELRQPEPFVIEAPPTNQGGGTLDPNPFDEQMLSKYAGLDKKALAGMANDLLTLHRETVQAIYEQKKRDGDYLEDPMDPSGMVKRPLSIPKGDLYMSVVNPEGRGMNPDTGTLYVRHLTIERDIYQDVYDLYREWEWVRDAANQ